MTEDERSNLLIDLQRTKWTHIADGGCYLVTHVDALHVGPETWEPCVRYVEAVYEAEVLVTTGYVRKLSDFVANLKRDARVA